MFNPDAPTNVGNFIQHTYRPMESVNDSFYYAGGTTNPFGNQTNMDSRRNMGVLNNGMYPPAGMPNNPQQQQPPTENVMPFSSYPPATPGVGNNCGMTNTPPAFNSLVDSRRNAGIPTNSANPTNPWAEPQQSQMIPQASQPQQMNNPWSNPYMNPQGMNYGNAYYPSEFSTSALYAGNQFGFDRKSGCWDNIYTTNRPVIAPVVDWNNSNNLNPTGYQSQYQQNLNPVYPIQTPKPNMTWAEIAEKNWGGNNL